MSPTRRQGSRLTGPGRLGGEDRDPLGDRLTIRVAARVDADTQIELDGPAAVATGQSWTSMQVIACGLLRMDTPAVSLALVPCLCPAAASPRLPHSKSPSSTNPFSGW